MYFYKQIPKRDLQITKYFSQIVYKRSQGLGSWHIQLKNRVWFSVHAGLEAIYPNFGIKKTPKFRRVWNW